MADFRDCDYNIGRGWLSIRKLVGFYGVGMRCMALFPLPLSAARKRGDQADARRGFLGVRASRSLRPDAGETLALPQSATPNVFALPGTCTPSE